MTNIRNIIEMGEAACFSHCLKVLKKMGYKVIRGGVDWMIGIPASLSPYCLVAHLDTIPRKQGVELVQDGVYLRNRLGVLGADDRAGVYAVLELAASHKPYVIFTTGEETGGVGVKRLIQSKRLDPYIDDIALFIEIDRQGIDEFVFYSWELPEEVQSLVTRYGFKEAVGSYSDVADLTDYYSVPHVNVSAGYFRQHSKHEYLDVSALEMTIYRLDRLMMEEPPRVLVRPWELEGEEDYVNWDDDEDLLRESEWLNDPFYTAEDREAIQAMLREHFLNGGGRV